MPKTRSKLVIPHSFLNLPEGMEPTGANVDGDRIEVTATPEGQDLSGSVVKKRFQGEEWFRIEWRDAPEEATEDTEE